MHTPWPDEWYSKHTLISLSPLFYFISAPHWFVSVWFTQQLFHAVCCFVLLSRDLVCLRAGLWDGSGWTGVSCKGVCLPLCLHPTEGRDLLFITGFIKGLKAMGRQIKPTRRLKGNWECCGDKGRSWNTETFCAGNCRPQRVCLK